MAEIKLSPHLDENLLHFKKNENLAKNYSNLKALNNMAKCIKTQDKCEIINKSEVSRAYTNYLGKLQSFAKINRNPLNEKLLDVCQKIQKSNVLNTADENMNMITSNISESHIERANNTNITSNSTQVVPNWNSHENGSENEVTVDDFLFKQDEHRNLESESQTSHILDSMPENEMQKKIFQTDPDIFQSNVTEEQDLCKSDEQNDDMSSQETNTSVKNNSQSISFQESNRPYVCPQCKMAFKRNLHLKRHFTVTHTVSKNFKCEICGKTFSRKDYLDKHVSGHQKKNFKLKLLQQGIVVRTKIFSKSNK